MPGTCLMYDWPQTSEERENWWKGGLDHPLEVVTVAGGQVFVKAKGKLWNRKEFEAHFGPSKFARLLEENPIPE